MAKSSHISEHDSQASALSVSVLVGGLVLAVTDSRSGGLSGLQGFVIGALSTFSAICLRAAVLASRATSSEDAQFTQATEKPLVASASKLSQNPEDAPAVEVHLESK